MDLHNAALPVVHLQLRRLLQLHPESPAREWRRALLDGGLLTELPPEVGDPEDPREWMRALQGLLDELDALEQRLAGLRSRDDRPRWKDAPWWLWVALLFQPLVAVLFGTLMGPIYEDRLWGALAVFGLPGAAAIGILVWAYGRATVRRELRRQEIQRVVGQRQELRQGLAGGCRALSERSFLARAGGRLVLCTADLDWLERQARDARQAGHADRARALEAERSRLEEAVQQAILQPPEGWAAVGALGERDRWEVQEAGPPRPV